MEADENQLIDSCVKGEEDEEKEGERTGKTKGKDETLGKRSVMSHTCTCSTCYRSNKRSGSRYLITLKDNEKLTKLDRKRWEEDPLQQLTGSF